MLNAVVRAVRPRSKEAISTAKVRVLFEDLHENYMIMRRHPKLLRQPFLWALMANVWEVASIYIVYVAFGEMVNVGAVILAYAVANFAGLVSVLPGGVGVYEGLMTLTLSSSKLVSSMSARSKGVARANYLRGIVVCGYCMKPFSSGVTTKKLKDGSTNEHYYYRCETPTCVFRNKSVRSTKVTLHVINFLKEHQFTTKENYDYWIGKAKERLKQTLRENETRMASLNKTVALKEQRYERTKDLIRNNPVLQEHYDLKAQKQEVDDLKNEQDKLMAERQAAKDALPTYEKYLELFKNTSDILWDEEDAGLKDSVVRIFFSNFVVKAEGKGKQQRCDITHKLNEPWEGFV